jgi:hypothetical protein
MPPLNYGSALAAAASGSARVNVRRVKNAVVDGYVVDISGDLPGPALRLNFPHGYTESDTGWTLTWGVPMTELTGGDRWTYAARAAERQTNLGGVE